MGNAMINVEIMPVNNIMIDNGMAIAIDKKYNTSGGCGPNWSIDLVELPLPWGEALPPLMAIVDNQCVLSLLIVFWVWADG